MSGATSYFPQLSRRHTEMCIMRTMTIFHADGIYSRGGTTTVSSSTPYNMEMMLIPAHRWRQQWNLALGVISCSQWHPTDDTLDGGKIDVALLGPELNQCCPSIKTTHGNLLQYSLFLVNSLAEQVKINQILCHLRQRNITITTAEDLWQVAKSYPTL